MSKQNFVRHIYSETRDFGLSYGMHQPFALEMTNKSAWALGLILECRFSHKKRTLHAVSPAGVHGHHQPALLFTACESLAYANHWDLTL